MFLPTSETSQRNKTLEFYKKHSFECKVYVFWLRFEEIAGGVFTADHADGRGYDFYTPSEVL